MTCVSRRTLMAGGIAALSAPAVTGTSLCEPRSAPVGEWWWIDGPKYPVRDLYVPFWSLRRVGVEHDKLIPRYTIDPHLLEQCVVGARFRFEGLPRFSRALEFQPFDHPAAIVGRAAADRVAVARSQWGLFWKVVEDCDGAFNLWSVDRRHFRLSYPYSPSVGLLSAAEDHTCWRVRYGWSWHGPLVVDAHPAREDEVRAGGWPAFVQKTWNETVSLT